MRLAGLLKNWLATETPRHREKMKSKRRPRVIAFLINSDLLFLCDSVSLWPISATCRGMISLEV